jgi:hypothetical protein
MVATQCDSSASGSKFLAQDVLVVFVQPVFDDEPQREDLTAGS